MDPKLCFFVIEGCGICWRIRKSSFPISKTFIVNRRFARSTCWQKVFFNLAAVLRYPGLGTLAQVPWRQAIYRLLAANLKSRLLAAGLGYLGLGYPGWRPNDATPILSSKPEIQGNYLKTNKNPYLGWSLSFGNIYIHIYLCMYMYILCVHA